MNLIKRIKLINPLTCMNVGQQLILLFLLLVTPVFALNWYGNAKAETILKRHVTSAYEELNKQNHYLINQNIDTISRIMTSIIQNPITQSLAETSSDKEQFDRVVQYGQLDMLLRNNAVSLFEGEAVYYFLFVYDPDHLYDFAPKLFDINRLFNASTVFFYSDTQKIPWIEEALAAKGKGVLSFIDNFALGGNQKTVAYMRAVNSISNGRTILGVLVGTKMDKKLEEAFSTVSLPSGGEIYLTDWSNRVLASTSSAAGQILPLPDSLAGNDEMEQTASVVTDKEIFVVHKKFSVNQKLVYVIPINSLLQQQNTVKRIIQTISVVYSLLAIAVMVYFWRSLMNPLRKLAHFARFHDPDQEPGEAPQINRRDEVGMLILTVHDMARRIHNMVRSQYDMEIREKESQLQLLYQQINPHVLYNTLESIYWKCSLEGSKVSAEMIKDLSKLMRISLSRGRELITVEEELVHAKAYVNLQQKRHEYGFTIRWEIDSQVLGCLIPKITIQPLLENAIIHGVLLMGQDGLLVVTAATDGHEVIISIEDNGYKPTDYAAINALLAGAQPEGASGYGIKNVNRRLQLHFGDDYGLYYEAHQPEGTRVKVTIPFREQGKDRKPQ